MPRLVSIACLAVVFSSASISAGFGADTPIPDFKESIFLRASANAQIADGRVIEETIKELKQRSATFDQMLRVIAASHILTFISPSVDASLVSGLIGRTRFVVGASSIAAFVEVVTPRDRPRVRREALAHELAHVVEIACLGPIGSETTLGRRLRPQLTWNANLREGMETRFAVSAGEAVLREAREKSKGASHLAQLIEREGLTACPPITPALEVVGAVALR